MICNVMEAWKDGSHRLFYQGLLSCELLPTPAAWHACSAFGSQIKYVMQVQYTLGYLYRLPLQKM